MGTFSGSPGAIPGCNCPACRSGSSWTKSSHPNYGSGSAAPRMPGFDGHGSKDFGFTVGTVRGYRWWKLNAPDLSRSWDDWKADLLSGAQNCQWKSGFNEASCNYHPEHQPPVEYDEARSSLCGCGFWGYWELQSHNVGAAMPVAGVIEGSGRTLVGERGFRCQKARIVALYLPWTLEPAPGFGAWSRDNGQLLGPAGNGNAGGARLTEGGRRTFEALTGFGAEPEPPALTPAAEQELAKESEEALARQYGLAWMGVIQDRIQLLYPDVEVFTTRGAMLAKFPPVGEPGPGERRFEIP